MDILMNLLIEVEERIQDLIPILHLSDACLILTFGATQKALIP
jgi:hypothetical protein